MRKRNLKFCKVTSTKDTHQIRKKILNLSTNLDRPVSPSLSELRMNNDFTIYATGVENFGPLFVKSIFAEDSSTLFKVWDICIHVQEQVGVILDVVPHTDSTSFLKSFRRFASRRGCPSVMISHNGRNFVSNETAVFLNGSGVD